jgi:hypothetical protein
MYEEFFSSGHRWGVGVGSRGGGPGDALEHREKLKRPEPFSAYHMDTKIIIVLVQLPWQGGNKARSLNMDDQVKPGHDRPEPSDNLRLTPSEIESLRKHGEKISLQARGRFKDLFEDKDTEESGNVR